jgi:Rrf2 family protein
MKLSTRGRYALRMMVDIARNADSGKPVSLALVAERTDISRGYLEQLAMLLRNARILRSMAGRHGGYLLARPASEITIGEIIEATIGPVAIVGCVEDFDTCMRAPDCECRIVYALINQRIAGVLHGFSLADLLDPGWIATVSQELDAGGTGLGGSS